MDPQFTRPFRASIAARSRLIEDLVSERAASGVGQYVILGSGLDTFAQRRPDVASRMRVLEVDRPGHQAYGMPSRRRFAKSPRSLLAPRSP
jgi:O-methyltransferase involved in polyketide biosynthesis